MIDGILQRKDGRYEAWINIQDGFESNGDFSLEAEARVAWSVGHKAWNNNDYKPKDARLYAWQSVGQEVIREVPAPTPKPRALPALRGGALFSDWTTDTLVGGDAMWRAAVQDHVTFLRYDLPMAWTAWPADEPETTHRVIGAHRVHGVVTLPVAEVNLPMRGTIVALSGDLHSWRVAVVAPNTATIDPRGLFDPSDRIDNPWSAHGLPRDLASLGTYAQDPRAFVARVQTNYQVYTLVHLLARASVVRP